VKTTHVTSVANLAYGTEALGLTAVNILPGGQSLGGGVSGTVSINFCLEGL
jgi:hypothetical protein